MTLRSRIRSSVLGRVLTAAALLVLLTAGCERRPLESMERITVRTIVKCVWKVVTQTEVQFEKPTGVTLYFFRDGIFYNSFTTAEVDSCEVQLEKGHYKMYMISQSPEEFWRMEFRNMTSFDNAMLNLRETDVSWTRGLPEATVENPEILYIGVADEFEITEEMTEDYQYYYSNLRRIRANKAKAIAAGQTKADTEDPEEAYYAEQVRYHTIKIPVYPHNVVSQLWITIYSGNADVLKSVRASTSGMARTYELTQDVTGAETATQVMSSWKLTMDDPERRVGHIDGLITTLGLPNGETPGPQRDSSLNVSALLVDNATIANYKFEVGDKIQVLKPNPGFRNLYRLIFGSVEEPSITPPDVQPEGGTASGMDATVSEWEEGETVDVPM